MICFVVLLSVVTAGVSHWRYGTLSWEPASSSVTPNAAMVRFTLELQWDAAGFSADKTIVGSQLQDTAGSNVKFSFGDNTPAIAATSMYHTVTRYDSYTKMIVTEWTNDHTYPSNNNNNKPWTASYSGDQRPSNLENNRAGGWNLQASVDRAAKTQVATQSNRSPKPQLFHFVTVCTGNCANVGAFQKFKIPAVDVDGDNLRYTIASSVEQGVAVKAPIFSAGYPGQGSAFGEMIIDQSTGYITWSKNLGADGNWFQVTVMVEDLDVNNKVKSRVPIDFMINQCADPTVAVGQNANSRAKFDLACQPGVDAAVCNAGSGTTPTRVNCLAKEACTISVKAKDVDAADKVNIHLVSSLPNPSVITPMVAANPAIRTITFTPPESDICNKNVICFEARDSSAQSCPSLPHCIEVTVLSNKPQWTDTTPAHNSKVTAYVDEEVKFTVQAADENNGEILKIEVLEATGMPFQAVLGENIGTNPIERTFAWTPGTEQIGESVVCFRALTTNILCDNKYSDNRCIIIEVIAPKPYFLLPAGAKPSFTGRVGSTLKLNCSFTEEHVVNNKVVHRYEVVLSTYTPTHGLPRHATFTFMERMNGKIGAAATTAATAKTRPPLIYEFAWKPSRGQEGFEYKVVFVGRDKFQYKTVLKVVYITIKRGQYAVNAGDSLRSIAEDYDTDYLQLWGANPEIKNPDSMLPESTMLNIGVIYTVRESDTLQDIAQRFQLYEGNIDRLYAVNPDLYYNVVTLPKQACTADPTKSCLPNYNWIKPGMELCIILPVCTYKYNTQSIFVTTGRGPDTGGQTQPDSLATMGQAGTVDQANEERGALGRIDLDGHKNNEPYLGPN